MSIPETTTHVKSTEEELRDGGYYAIKGFLYQFDLTIETILNNPSQHIEFENVQDINYETYVIQVKHKETQNYQPSQIRKPIIQLIKIFQNNSSKKLCLYCHFKDRQPEAKSLTLEALNQILGVEKDKFDADLKNEFLNNFILRFFEDYESRFTSLIGLIMTSYNLVEQEIALLYHGIIRSRLLELSIKDRASRSINKQELDQLISSNEKVVFHEAYRKYLDNEKYERFIKKEYFTHRRPNVLPFERLFIIDGEGTTTTEPHLLDTIEVLFSKYYRIGSSPAPYVCFRNINPSIITNVKHTLVDKNFGFTDGTCFNGDYFRINKLIESATKENGIKIKFITEENLPQLLHHLKIDEVYDFFHLHNSEIDTNGKHIKINISDINQALKIIK